MTCFKGQWQGELNAQAEIAEYARLNIADTHLFAPAIRQMVQNGSDFYRLP